MNDYERIQNAVQFIEEHLQNDLNISDIAAKSGFSPFHFQRLFQAISGFSVYQYIRNRRL
ncbi:AraC family transcriptional regulator, partial [Bacillus licheniformis]|uniref:AraC family transcriptional regulator n=1 Tax=Bacillus licheniformis TaxID=1402 RepID=UPI0034A03458